MWNVITDTKERGGALGHFNCAELSVWNAIVRAAQKMDMPVIIGLSESEREFFGLENAVALVRALRARGVPIFLNADHTKSFKKIQEAVDAGFDMVIFDGSHLPLEDNIRETKNIVRYVKTVRPQVFVEGEVGYIGEGSKMRTTIPKGIRKTTVVEAVRFVQETGIDMLAPAVGNIHGMIKSGEPQLDIKLIKKIKNGLRCALGRDMFLVLHGASGNSDKDIRAAIKAGISIVHISTEIRVAWRDALRITLHKNLDEIAPYSLLRSSEEAAYTTIKEKIRLCTRA